MTQAHTTPATQTITLSIDGQSVTVAKGSTILQAAAAAGIDIPHLCYDPALRLPPTSSCRLCLVEIEGARSLAASCSAPAAQGMVVRTNTDKLQQSRRMVIELLLSDHPDDCLTCEKSGSCRLQQYAYDLGVRQPKFRFPAAHPAPTQDGPAIIYDRSKCILCGRCVEVCQGVQVSGAVDYLGRGFDTRIALPAGQSRQDSTCAECGNCLDVCPTGALSAAGSARLARSWELKQVPTICPYCGCGCTIVLNIRDNRVVQITGQPGQGASRGLLCVKGRFGIDFIAHSERLTTPLIRRNGQLEPASWDEALDLVATRLAQVKAAHGPDSIGALSSAKCTNEENYLLQKFARAALGTNNVDHCARLCHASTVTGLAKAFGSGAMTNSVDDFEQSACIFIIGSNTTECHPVIGAAIKRAAVGRKIALIVADPRTIELTQYAAIHLRHRPGSDVALVNTLIHVILAENLQDHEYVAQRTEGFDQLQQAVAPYTPELGQKITGVSADLLVQAARLYARSRPASIVYSMGITQHATGTDNVVALANLAMVTGNVGKPGSGVNPLRGQNNVQGACDMGALPNVYPGYQKVDDPQIRAKFEKAWARPLPAKPGLPVTEMMNAAAHGQIKALFIMGENPMLSDPDISHVGQALDGLEFLAVQDIFLSETARKAHVVLPAAGFAEKDGTFTNTERRVQRVRQAVQPPGQARPDWEILCDLSTRMGVAMHYDHASAIMDEIASLTPSYGGINFARLDQGGLQWPCPKADHPGTSVLHVGKFTRGLGKFHPVEYLPPKELPDAEYPLVLSTGRVLQHFHTGTMSRRSAVLDTLVPQGLVEVNPADAQRLGVADGQTVRLTSRRGQIQIAAKITDRVSAGTVFMAFHYREAAANLLTNPALDPEAKIPEFKVCAVRLEACK